MVQTQSTHGKKKSWLKYVIIAVIAEKIIQHIVVTWAFYSNMGGIRAQVAVNPDVLMVLGGIVTILFILGPWGLLKGYAWAVSLLIGLALFDFIGEFVAQGTLAIMINVSFLMAILLLILSLVYRKRAADR